MESWHWYDGPLRPEGLPEDLKDVYFSVDCCEGGEVVSFLRLIFSVFIRVGCVSGVERKREQRIMRLLLLVVLPSPSFCDSCSELVSEKPVIFPERQQLVPSCRRTNQPVLDALLASDENYFLGCCGKGLVFVVRLTDLSPVPRPKNSFGAPLNIFSRTNEVVTRTLP